MTDIGVYSTAIQAENLSWDLSQPDVPYAEGATLNLALFTQAQHFPNGYIPSGTVLGRVTATGLLGPYLGSASDGRETAVGVLKASVHVIAPAGGVKTRIGCAIYKAFAVISRSKLPLTSASAAGGGYLDASAETDLQNIHFAA